ncbi:1-acyl-sn-glycerol-3-phosphate acyltransferase [Blastopirellula sp. JC732]|uniref:1-acyl-sn-glycerol-3-phosphate acyltransferase n=1 Tax=Blastopirellula sediminis TaxID=2894196 RepID=A0A9X1MQR3_9BACT|nr:1-acyl-sn-glycerol-3-phosphate acyltransferase [Blastopirellula sediminis]MCC9604942.1 1-acyl-sn-glycerol-3-phosphate acyltransferase [Blastopirellula sediminis]MCC9631758.1 1-acyl-sn-glycerol-3-phosphate acyltransferase [Blastopirellula sediminis]
MQQIVFEKPYTFIPPHRGHFWPALIQRLDLYGYYLRKKEGVESYELRNQHLLRESLDAGHGVMMAPNHCRTSDPLTLGYLAKDVGFHLYAMASWHLFNQGWFNSLAIRLMGGFSIYREGIDRQAINTAIDALATAERPLLVFPEGSTTRTNDRIHALLDGVTFIARAAAKKRAKSTGGKVVIHPIGIKYLFRGDLRRAVDPVLTEIEHRLTWKPQSHLPLFDRIAKVGMALLALKESEYFQQIRTGSTQQRLDNLINRLLGPLEEEWQCPPEAPAVVPRVKALRMKIMPAMVKEALPQEERNRRWDQLADIYLAQQLSCYLPDYLAEYPSVDRLLETVERYEEDLTDKVRVHGKLHVVIDVDPAIEVSPERDRSASIDPLSELLRDRLAAKLAKLSRESPLYQD